MKTPKYVIAPEGCAKYLTPGKGYIVEEFDVLPGEDIYDCGFTITDDMGERVYSTLRKSAHLNGGDWIIPDGEAEREPDTFDVQPVKTLRDEFAMAIIGGLYAAQIHGLNGSHWQQFAEIAYQQADAMLAARKESE